MMSAQGLFGAGAGTFISTTYGELPAASLMPLGSVRFVTNVGFGVGYMVVSVSGVKTWLPISSIGSYEFSALPSPASVPAGVTASVTNWRKSFITDGTRWRPDGPVDLYVLPAPVSGLANTLEQIVGQITVPIGLCAIGSVLRVFHGVSKSANSDTLTWRLRFGRLGTIADVQLKNSSIAATNISFGGLKDYQVISNTSVLPLGSGASVSYAGATTNAAETALPIDDISANVMHLSLTVQMTGGTEIPTLRSLNVQLLSG